jgi:hypothetical protein
MSIEDRSVGIQEGLVSVTKLQLALSFHYLLDALSLALKDFPDYNEFYYDLVNFFELPLTLWLKSGLYTCLVV